jgi:hypothetical protein
MKEIIRKSVPSSFILLQEIELSQANIGILLGNGKKVVLVPSAYESELFFARCLDGWAIGNNYSPDGQYKKTINDWMKFFEGTHEGTTYLFDTPQDLFKWLGE